ncbi:hypothetical protein IAQ61_005081 [Plenodomus lingam]|uniref:uncharacterized protein n=1 Tax=Leptosphaeria maculans TaxID=5022 RepID=UPI003318454D|nr:hypothetical protein IAQ61_005081 [Plenodomus lingam]
MVLAVQWQANWHDTTLVPRVNQEREDELALHMLWHWTGEGEGGRRKALGLQRSRTTPPIILCTQPNRIAVAASSVSPYLDFPSSTSTEHSTNRSAKIPMATVLSPIVQPSSPITMPYSSSDAYQNQPTQPKNQQPRSTQMPRNQYNGTTGTSGATGYRGTSTPIAPYAFSSTPQLRQENKSAPAANGPTAQQQQQQARLGHPSHPSSSSDSTVSTSGSSSRSSAGPPLVSKDDGDLRKPVDNFTPSISLSIPDLSLTLGGDAPVKPSPGRYRRAPGRTDSSTSVPTGATTPTQRSPSIGFSTAQPAQSAVVVNSDNEPSAKSGHNRANSAGETQITRQGGVDPAKRYRRRSSSGVEASNLTTNMATLQVATNGLQAASPNTGQPKSSSGRPASSRGHERQGSVGSTTSKTSSQQQPRPEVTTQRSYASVAGGGGSKAAAGKDAKASESVKRHAPSPLSNPLSPSGPPSPTTPQSTAAQQLAALNDKEKGMKSRLRRAFSFGSAAELRRASAENTLSAERAKLRKERYHNDEDAEQAAIIAKQEAAGIGAGIYSGQGGIGSTDNLSIQSAASSASIMLRKMGHGMKKGTKSIKGLFRPKSVIGVPAADGPIASPSVGQVSLVTVEAERQKVNVNANPHEQAGGGTGYPRLERNSVDAGHASDVANPSAMVNDSFSRRSIVGGDRERAEVLSSMKRGILKRTGTNSDSGSPVLKPVDAVPNAGNSRSNSPSTPRTDGSQPRSDDYFAKPPRIHNGSTRSLPITPHGGLKNISFSPRIQFHDAWSPQDYDRRGDIATCNRLTPMLAQQIKEELNSFKMEMEVHEASKPHTHFF